MDQELVFLNEILKWTNDYLNLLQNDAYQAVLHDAITRFGALIKDSEFPKDTFLVWYQGIIQVDFLIMPVLGT